MRRVKCDDLTLTSWRSTSFYVRTAGVGIATSAGVLALAIGAWTGGGQVAGDLRLCADRPAASSAGGGTPSRTGNPFARPASDLYCVDLFSTALGGDALGVVEMGRVPTPFGVAVTPEGHHEYALTAWIEGLPDVTSLGPYNAYMAWATTPVFDQLIKLGEVSNGTNTLGTIALNKFLIMISAEASADVSGREGRLVLRGRSPSSLMEAHDLLAQAPSAAQAPAMRDGHDMEGMDGNGWMRPPSYPGVRMLPGLMGLSPRVSPLLPSPGDATDLPAGSTTDILLELSNPGRWMVHCHIAEHLESGMKFVMEVEGQ